VHHGQVMFFGGRRHEQIWDLSSALALLRK
jgi:hypothetical protein